MWGPTQNLGPIGSSVLTFIGYNRIATQTDPRQTSKLYRSRFLRRFAPIFYSIANSFDHSFTFQGSCEVPHKIRARSVQPFWRLLDKQANRHILIQHICAISDFTLLLLNICLSKRYLSKLQGYPKRMLLKFFKLPI